MNAINADRGTVNNNSGISETCVMPVAQSYSQAQTFQSDHPLNYFPSHQTQSYGETDVEDRYGYLLSESGFDFSVFDL